MRDRLFQWFVLRCFALVLRRIREQSRRMHLDLLALRKTIMAQLDDLKAALVEANEKTDAIALALEADGVKLEEVSGDVDKLIEIAQTGGGDLTEVVSLAQSARDKLASVAANKAAQSEQLNAVAAKYERT